MSLKSKAQGGSRRREALASQRPSSNIGSKKSEDDLDAHETEVEELRNQLMNEMRRNTTLDSELRLAIMAAHKAEEAHQKELTTSEADVKRLITERRKLMSKFADAEVVEGAVRELYVQMKDRLTEDAPRPTPEQLQAEKANLEREPILAVVGALRARLEGLWKFKVEAEDDLRASRTAQKGRANAEASVLKLEMHALETELRQTQKELLAARAEKDAAKEALTALADEAHAVTADMASQHAELLSALRASVKEGGVAQRQAAAAYAEGKARDALVLANKQLESARHFDRVTQDKELRRLQHDHEVELRDMTHQLRSLSHEMLKNSKLKAELDQSQTQVANLQRQVPDPTDENLLTHRVRHLEQELEVTRRSLSHTMQQLTKHQNLRNSQAHSPVRSLRPGSEGASTRSIPGSPHQTSLSATSRKPQLTGRANASMTSNAHAIMTGARTAAERARQQAAGNIEDPVYHVIANVEAMNQAAKSTVREVKHEIDALGCSSETAAEQASHPQGPIRTRTEPPSARPTHAHPLLEPREGGAATTLSSSYSPNAASIPG